MKITEKEFNIITGKETITERDLTPEELDKRKATELEAAQRLALHTQVETAKAIAQAKLAALGLTADDLKALGL